MDRQHLGRRRQGKRMHRSTSAHDTLRAIDAVYGIFEYNEEVQKPKKMGSGFSSWWIET
jgi:hypothetical protein